METIQKETYRKKKNTEKNKQNISEMWDNFKQSNMHIIRVPKGERGSQKKYLKD